MFTPNPYGMFSMPTLETERLILRRIAMRDAKDIFAYSKDAEVARHVLWSAQKDVSEARDYCRFMMKRYRSDLPSSWGIIQKQTNQLVGTIGYMDYSEDNASVEVGYSLARRRWNRGYMTEALAEVLRFSFEELGVHRVEAQHEVENAASGAVMRKCGMRKEGTLRGRLYNKGRYVDVDLYAMLREDYARWARTEK